MLRRWNPRIGAAHQLLRVSPSHDRELDEVLGVHVRTCARVQQDEAAVKIGNLACNGWAVNPFELPPFEQRRRRCRTGVARGHESLCVTLLHEPSGDHQARIFLFPIGVERLLVHLHAFGGMDDLQVVRERGGQKCLDFRLVAHQEELSLQHRRRFQSSLNDGGWGMIAPHHIQRDAQRSLSPGFSRFVRALNSGLPSPAWILAAARAAALGQSPSQPYSHKLCIGIASIRAWRRS